jgi:serine/threonine protein kinase
MGTVYEAEHLESGRIVALKVLSHALDSGEARKRFLREGRLAASINHPNSVYVYGTEEIEGTPAISMELVPGGTLVERVEKEGPMPVTAAVDAILQIIAGLDAAHAIGILHRDIKPSNCFIDTDGTVKIGDFGLSISTAARGDTALTVAGSFMGTPAFSSPEQLRGEELNVRSDMYSVGVTLFYLLTGRTPFHSDNMVQLLATVLEKPAPSPATFRPGIPSGLGRIVLRCLQKQPGERFKNYAELRLALASYTSAAPTPATLGLRFVAGVVDHFLLVGTVMVLQFLVISDAATLMNGKTWQNSSYRIAVFGNVLIWLAVYAVGEGLWGRSPAKALFGLRVARLDRQRVGIGRALVRALIFVGLPSLPTWIFFTTHNAGNMSASPWRMLVVSYSYFAIVALLFLTVRRRNGFAAVHDLVTKTRVILRSSSATRPPLETAAEPAALGERLSTLGPYHVLGPVPGAGADLLVAYDTRLLRKVWIRPQPPGAPPVPIPLRGLARPGRLRWLNSKRSMDENWDAFEAPPGEPLTQLLESPQSWSRVRYWLLDLTDELQAASQDGTMPATLALDRVWITSSGSAKLLDFPISAAPTRLASSDASPPAEPLQFLEQVANAALGEKSSKSAGGENPAPLHARQFVAALPTSTGLDAVASQLRSTLHSLAVVTRGRRAALAASCAAFPLMAAAMALAVVIMLHNVSVRQPELARLFRCLISAQIAGSEAEAPGAAELQKQKSRAWEVYIAHTFGGMITNGETMNTLYARTTFAPRLRALAERSVREHPNLSEQEIRNAMAILKPDLDRHGTHGLDIFGTLPPYLMGLIVFASSLAIYVALPALICAIAFRGGPLLRLFGVAVVRRNGLRASRGRILWRSLLAWSPILLAAILAAALAPGIGGTNAAALATALYGMLLVASLAMPGRSLQDRLAGTCLVPR